MTEARKKLFLLLTTLFAFIACVLAVSMYIPTYALTTDVTEAISIRNEAQVRLDDSATTEKNETGIRFFVDVNLENLSTLLASYPDYDAEYGVAMLPTKYLDGAELDVESTYTYNGQNVSQLHIPLTQGVVVNHVKTYKAVLTDIPSLNYETDVAARGYIKLTKEGADTVYIQTPTTVVRSIGQVATAFYLDKEEITDDEEPLYKSLLEENLGTVSFDKESYTVFMNENDENDYLTEYKVYGNKYGFELDSAFFTENNVDFVYGTENVVRVADNKITAIGRGTSTVSFEVKGKTGSTSVKVENTVDLAESLETDELAVYNHKGYETMVSVISGVKKELSVGDYHGKTSVLKVAGTIEGGMSLVKLDLPKQFAAGTTVTIQIYVEAGSVAYGCIGLSSSTTSVAWGSPAGGDKYSMGKWESLVVSAPIANSLYLAMSSETLSATDDKAFAGAGNYFIYYISSVLVGDQVLKITKDELALTLGQNELATFDDDKYLELISYMNYTATAEIVEDEKDTATTKRKVLRITGPGGFGKVRIDLPKTITSSFTMEFRMEGVANGTSYYWAVMNSLQSWDLVTWMQRFPNGLPSSQPFGPVKIIL